MGGIGVGGYGDHGRCPVAAQTAQPHGQLGASHRFAQVHIDQQQVEVPFRRQGDRLLRAVRLDQLPTQLRRTVLHQHAVGGHVLHMQDVQTPDHTGVHVP